jgi:hypothetical protein
MRLGTLSMLCAYFDDSGARSGANVTLLAGLFGNPHQWDHFNGLWQQALEAPLDGAKPRVQRFHMFDCYAGRKEFTGWVRSEAEDFAQQLGNILFKCGLWGGVTVATARAGDRRATGDQPRESGEAEAGAIRNSFHLALDWARKNAAYDREIAFVLDDRPERKKEYEAAYAAFLDHARAANILPLPASLTFANSAKELPLQAADLFAWEIYQDELSFLHRERPAGQFNQKLLARMAASGRFRIQSATPETIGSLVESLEKAGPISSAR